ncbi:unnamed protein product [Heterobilharzia americana]|nr:unnamed protein product [Heterobilharzia americana]
MRRLKITLQQNGYPLDFINKHMSKRGGKIKKDNVAKMPVYLRLNFKGDFATDILTHLLSRSVKRTFIAAKLFVSFSIKPLLTQRTKYRLPMMATSMCIYEFNCSCVASYIGCTQRALSMHVCEHVPSWLANRMTKISNSAILSRLADTGHEIKVDHTFPVMYCVPRNLPKGARLLILSIAEAIGINARKPDLCAQKKYVHPLCLPWLTTGSTRPL